MQHIPEPSSPHVPQGSVLREGLSTLAQDTPLPCHRQRWHTREWQTYLQHLMVRERGSAALQMKGRVGRTAWDSCSALLNADTASLQSRFSSSRLCPRLRALGHIWAAAPQLWHKGQTQTCPRSFAQEPGHAKAFHHSRYAAVDGRWAQKDEFRGPKEGKAWCS